MEPGAAWALHGMANTYRYTRDIQYLEAAKRVAHFFIASLEEDSIPAGISVRSARRWNHPLMKRRKHPRRLPSGIRQRSCAASGLLELADLVPITERALYRESALRIINSLTAHYAEWDDPAYEGILKEATGHLPAGQNINVSLIYGDYYYVETAPS